ncbi:hypothetical protein BJ912DRAFT_1069877 [Pholiota molesta]|nr:hypothetical protein BJ912DRAFT_1069877 [Pholiota molesta]
MSIVLRSTLERSAVIPLSAVFAALHLPAAHTLALSPPRARVWEDRRALCELASARGPAARARGPPRHHRRAAYPRAAHHRARPAPARPPSLSSTTWPRTGAPPLRPPACTSRCTHPRRRPFLALFVRGLLRRGARVARSLNPERGRAPVRAVVISNCAPFFHRISVRMMAARVRESAGTRRGSFWSCVPGWRAGRAGAGVWKEWGPGGRGFLSAQFRERTEEAKKTELANEYVQVRADNDELQDCFQHTDWNLVSAILMRVTAPADASSISTAVIEVKTKVYGDPLAQLPKGYAEEVYGFKNKGYFDSTYFPKIFIALNRHKLEIAVAFARVAVSLEACSTQRSASYSTLTAGPPA